MRPRDRIIRVDRTLALNPITAILLVCSAVRSLTIRNACFIVRSSEASVIQFLQSARMLNPDSGEKSPTNQLEASDSTMLLKFALAAAGGFVMRFACGRCFAIHYYSEPFTRLI